MLRVPLLITGFLAGCCFLRPDKAGEILAVGLPAAVVVVAVVGRVSRSIARGLAAEERDIARLTAANDELERRVDALRRRPN